jgi:hypothetical protein
MSKMLGIVKGKSFTMQVNRKGEITGVQGFDKIGEQIASEMGSKEGGKPPMLDKISSLFSDTAARSMFSSAFDIFPPHSVMVGAQWQKSSLSLGPGSGALTNFRLKQVEGDKATISCISPGKAALTGKLIVNTKTGLVTNAIFQQKRSGKRTVLMNGKVTGREM